MLEAILWMLAAGLPCRHLPGEFVTWESAYTRFSRWRDTDVLERVLRDLQSRANALGELDLNLHPVDPSVGRAPQSAAGAGGDQALWRSRGGLGTKLHQSVESGFCPMLFLLTGGARQRRPLPATAHGGRHGIRAMVPTKSNQRDEPRFDRWTYRESSLVERYVGRLEEHRRIGTRYEKHAKRYLAMLHLTAILMWI